MSSLDKLGQADLLLLVKTAQKQRLAGPNGEWNEYLKVDMPLDESYVIVFLHQSPCMNDPPKPYYFSLGKVSSSQAS